MSKIAVVVAADAGSVLALVADAAVGETAPAIEAAVGDGLILRDPATGANSVTLPPDAMTVELVDPANGIFMFPFRYGVVDGQLEEQNVLNSGEITFAGGEVTVTLPAATAEKLEAVIYVEGGSPPELKMKTIEIPATTSVGKETLTLAPGDYGVVAIVPGYWTVYKPESIS